MNKYIKFSAALPLLVLAGACSSDKEAPEAPLEGEFSVIMSIGGTAPTRAVSPEVESLQKNQLAFATYNADGTLKDMIFNGPDSEKANTDLRAYYFLPNWGPAVAAHLKKEDYKDGFTTAAFNVPAAMRSKTFSLANMDNADMNTLVWPGRASDGYVWNPYSEEGVNNMPMAGRTAVSAATMKQYNEEIYSARNAMRLPDVDMTRALAKIVIVDADGIIDKVELDTPQYGYICPEPTGWMNGDRVLRPHVPAVSTLTLKQTLSASNATVSYNGAACRAYEFYSFESSFYDADGNLAAPTDPVRDIALIYANEDSGLQNTSRSTTTLTFAPHRDFVVDAEADLATVDNGAWQGVMRNTVYTFVVHRPPTGGVEVVLKATPWDHTVGDVFHF
ncbi:MAG: hypothetical protein K2J70_05075 [Muribaculaceae bacterium]|nr:hypothetical protein [Muribaculaceae bacterium]